MAGVTLNLDGMADVLGALDRYARAVPPRVSAVVERFTEIVAREAKGLAPVDTGDLRGTIRAVLSRIASEGVGEVHAGGIDGVDYALWVEVGTRFSPAQPYLVPALEAHRAAFVRAIREALRGARP